jgi:YkoY family integral membrane protein
MVFDDISLSQASLIVFNLIIIESLLSVDNAAVLATMVMDLPKQQRGKALRYGIVGAYIFRGICLVLAAWLINIWWLKPIGGAYLLYLTWDYFNKRTHSEQHHIEEKDKNILFRFLNNRIGIFWSTVVLVETMDLVFSIDNVLAAAAFVEKVPKPTQTYLLWLGVFIGILAMRFVAQTFVRLMEKYPFLEKCAFIVIFVLGIKLLLSGIAHFIPGTALAIVIDSHEADQFVSIITTAIFVIPIITSFFFNWPKKHRGDHSELKDELKDYDDMSEEKG